MAGLDTVPTPSLTLEEILSDGSTLTNPAADNRRLFLGEDGLLHLRDSAGAVTDVGSGYAPGGTDVAVADGGTGASTAAAARTNLGLVIGTDVQAFDADIPTVAGSQGEMEAGTEAALRSMSPLRVAQAIAALGGGGGSTIQHGGLKPATPLDDFDGAALDGAWSANSSQGSFATTDCFTQAVDGSHLSMGFQAKNGRLYRAATDVDQEWLAGGIVPAGTIIDTAQEPMFGIALLNTSGTGVGIIVYKDGNAYLCSITTWVYGSPTGTFAGFGYNLLEDGPYALRITRVGNLFTGYISIDGVNWTAASATLTSAFTVGYKALGVFYNPAQAYKGRLFVDWVHTA